MKNIIILLLALLWNHFLFAQNQMDIHGAIKIGSNDLDPPEMGMIRWNSQNLDFEGFNGTKWVSFTCTKGFWGNSAMCATENSKLTASDGVPYDEFGESMDLDKDYLLITAVGLGENWPTTATPGKAYIFENRNDQWDEKEILIASDGVGGDFFGRSAGLHNDYAVIGADFHNGRQGAAYIFHRTDDEWIEEAKIIPSDAGSNDDFGYSVDIDNDYIIVGAPWNDVIGLGNNSGRAYIFHRDGTNWIEQSLLEPSDIASQDLFGSNVNIQGDFAAVGTLFNESLSAPDQRSVYIFKRTGSNWQETQILQGSISYPTDRFGSTSDMHGNYLIIGAIGHDIGDISDVGKAYIFHYNGTEWEEQAILSPQNEINLNYFGLSVSIYDEYAVVSSKGQVHIFFRSGSEWTEQSCLKVADLDAPHDYLSAKIGDSNIAVGVNSQTVNGNLWQGQVFMYDRN